MYVWQNTIVDELGRLRPNAHVIVRDRDTLALATIYGDVDGIAEVANPLTTRAGFARFYAAPGFYQITASDDGFERVYEDVLLGVPVDAMPDFSSLVAPIVDAAIDPLLEELDTAIAALPDFVGFTVAADGTGSGLPVGWSSARTGTGEYRVTHNRASGTDYHPKLTVYDSAGGDRVVSAMMVLKHENFFDYRVRSIFDVASSSDARVDIEVTL